MKEEFQFSLSRLDKLTEYIKERYDFYKRTP